MVKRENMLPFDNRDEAGRFLASRLQRYAGRDDVTVLGLPRGGLPVAAPVAELLHAPLDVFLVLKLGVPGHEELAMGAIAENGQRVLNEDIVSHLSLRPEQIDQVVARERQELQRRGVHYRGDRPPAAVQNRIVILVDDGLATGASMRVAVQAVRQDSPARIVVAVPVAPPDACALLRNVADDVECGYTPASFMSVGSWYRDFHQVSDEEVRQVLAAHRAKPRRDAPRHESRREP
jgi:predicted phosphoribosyltransferase